MNIILLRPNDVLFFRDGRPMSGSLSGHGAAWPLPTVTNLALHAALHRAGLKGVHKHVPGRSSEERDFSDQNREKNGRTFGSLLTAGPFPVNPDGEWFFPRPLDAEVAGTAQPSFLPLKGDFTERKSSLPAPLKLPVANTEAASKVRPEAWLNATAYQGYLTGHSGTSQCFENDDSFSDTEFSYGIGIDPATGTQDGERFFSASFLRLREDWRLGCLAMAEDKHYRDKTGDNDLIRSLFLNHGTETPVVVGGQQRVCSVTRHTGGVLPLPVGQNDGYDAGGEFLVKWTLLTPAIFPEIGNHKGGWLPSWVDSTTGNVLLKSGEIKRKDNELRAVWRSRVKEKKAIAANLIAAMVGKPIPVTGYALPNGSGREKGGAKSSHMAVPAGSVYYFSCTKKEDATALANALNWHGSGDFTSIHNRRSTIMGEKGFGLGVCSPWKYHNGMRPGAGNSPKS